VLLADLVVGVDFTIEIHPELSSLNFIGELVMAIHFSLSIPVVAIRNEPLRMHILRINLTVGVFGPRNNSLPIIT